MNGNDRERLVQKVDTLVREGRLAPAIGLLEKVLQQGGPDERLLNRLGDLLLKLNRNREAAGAYQRLADFYAQKGFYLKAAAAETKALRADPERVDILERLAEFYFRANLPVEGRQRLLERATYCLEHGRLEEAIRLYRKLEELEPTNLQVRAKLVDLLATRGDTAAASEELHALATAILKMGEFDTAAKLALGALEKGLDPRPFASKLLAGLVHGGRLAVARDLVERLGVLETDPHLTIWMARVLAETGEPSRALEMARAALAAVPDRGVLESWLAVFDRERHPELVATLEMALTAAPTNNPGSGESQEPNQQPQPQPSSLVTAPSTECAEGEETEFILPLYPLTPEMLEEDRDATPHDGPSERPPKAGLGSPEQRDFASIEELARVLHERVGQQVGKHDWGTHLDMGLAYREMGLLDLAITEFRAVLKSPEHALEASTLIAACYRDQGLFHEAARWLEEALTLPSVSDQTELHLRYELARTYEMAGDVRKALANFARILAVDAGYRDVVDCVLRLRSMN